MPKPLLNYARMFVKRRGSTIIFVLFIMIVAMIITTTVTTIVLNNLRSTTAIAQQAHSFYAAQSLVERSLYYAVAQRGQYTSSVLDVANNINLFTQALSNQSTASIQASINTNFAEQAVPLNETAEFSVFGEDTTDGYQLVPLQNLSSFSINWREAADCTPGTSQVDVSYTAWTADRWEDISNPLSPQTHFIVTCPATTNPDGEPMCGSYTLGLDGGHLYKVRVTALNCNIDGVSAYANYDPSGPTLYASQLMLDGLGEYGDTRRNVSAELPWGTSVSGYADFVLFSEQEITK